jgi:hypothetical protein
VAKPCALERADEIASTVEGTGEVTDEDTGAVELSQDVAIVVEGAGELSYDVAVEVEAAGGATGVPAVPDRRRTGEVKQDRRAELKSTHPEHLTPAGDTARIKAALNKAMHTSM